MNIEEKNICWKLMARQLSGAITNEESQTLEKLKKGDPAISEYLRLFYLLWEAREEHEENKAAEAFKKCFGNLDEFR